MARSVRQSLFIAFSQSYAVLALQFVASVIVARLLTPEELGVFSITMVLIGIAHTLRDFGVVEYIVQEKTLTEDRMRSASMLTFLTAWGMAVLILLLSSPVAAFYRRPDMVWLLYILALNFLLLPFGSVIAAHLRRQLDFVRLARIHLAVAAVQALGSVLLAWLGFSYFGLAWASVAASLLNIILVRACRPPGFPKLPGLKEFRHVFAFGSFSSLTQLLKDLEKGAPDLILGRLLSMDAVAYFGRATGLIELFNRLILQAVEHVALPHLSERHRDGGSSREPFLISVQYLTGLAWPFYVLLAIAATPIIRVLFGDQWDAAIPILQILCLGEALIAPFYLQHQFAVSRGLVRLETLRSSLIVATRLLPLFLLPVYGLNVVAIGYATSYVFAAIVSHLLMQRVCELNLVDLFAAARASLNVTALSAVVLLLVSTAMPPDIFDTWLGLTAALAAMSASWLLGIRLFRHPMHAEIKELLRRFNAPHY